MWEMGFSFPFPKIYLQQDNIGCVGIAIFGSDLDFQLIFRIVKGGFSWGLQAAAEPWYLSKFYLLWQIGL